MSRLEAIWENPAYRFVLVFGLLLLAEAVVYPIVTKRWFFLVETLTDWTARVEYAVLAALFEGASLEGNLVRLDGFSVRIIEECTGVFEVIIFAAAVLAFPTTWPDKAAGLALGIPILYAFNVLRILVLVIVGRFEPSIFEFMHVYFWQATLIAMITSVWLLWIFKVVRRERPAPPGPGARAP